MNAKTNGRYSIDMCNGPLLSKILLFSVPLALSSILQLLFNAADLIVVSRFAGDNAMAAVGANSSIINLLVTLFLGLSVGANVQAARERGAGLHDELSRTVHTAMSLSVVGGVLLVFVGVFGAKKILTLMGSPEAIIDQAALYLRIYFLGMPASMVYNFGAALLRSVGDTRRPLVYLTIAGVVNVCLNLVLVIVFHLDVAGVGIATVTSQVVSAILVVRCLMKEGGDIHLSLRKLRIHRDKMKNILRVGLPAGLQGTLFSLSNVVIQSSVNSFGEIVVAGNAAALNVEGFLYCIEGSLQQATMSFTSQNLGAGKRERLPRILITSAGCMAVAAVLIVVTCSLFGEPVLGIYSQTPAVLEIANLRLGFMAKMYGLAGMMDILVGALRGMGQSVVPMIISLIGVCGFRLIWIATVFQIPAYHNILTIYTAYPVTWAMTALTQFACWLILMKRLNKTYKTKE